jgi:hypothetical protein
LYGIQYGEPGYDDPTGQRGVIISTTLSQDRNGSIRSSTKQVYEQVITDLREAAELMPLQASGAGVASGFLPTYGGIKGGRATKNAAYAYLSRVFFQAGTRDFNDSSLAYINKVLPPAGNTVAVRSLLDDYVDANGGNLTLNASNPFNKRGFDAAKETIFQVVNAVDEASGTFNTSNGLITSSYVWTSGNAQFPAYFITPEQFYNDAGYPQETSDKRWTYFMQDPPTESNGDGKCKLKRGISKVVAKYFFQSLPAPYDPNIGVVNIVICRLSELILTRAEINAYKGNLTEAMADINAIRRRGFGVNNTDNTWDLPTSLTQDQLITKIKQERMRELAFEGDRLYNLKRMARLFENGVYTGGGLTRQSFLLTDKDNTQCDRVLVNIHVNDPQLLFQIPDAELSSNPNIRRN